MAKEILGGVLGAVEVAGHGAAEVTGADLERHARGALVAAGEIVADPGDVVGERRVDSTGRDEYARVHNAGGAANGRGGDGHDESDQDGEHREEDVWPS